MKKLLCISLALAILGCGGENMENLPCITCEDDDYNNQWLSCSEVQELLFSSCVEFMHLDCGFYNCFIDSACYGTNADECYSYYEEKCGMWIGERDLCAE